MRTVEVMCEFLSPKASVTLTTEPWWRHTAPQHSAEKEVAQTERQGYSHAPKRVLPRVPIWGASRAPLGSLGPLYAGHAGKEEALLQQAVHLDEVRRPSITRCFAAAVRIHPLRGEMMSCT